MVLPVSNKGKCERGIVNHTHTPPPSPQNKKIKEKHSLQILSYRVLSAQSRRSTRLTLYLILSSSLKFFNCARMRKFHLRNWASLIMDSASTPSSSLDCGNTINQRMSLASLESERIPFSLGSNERHTWNSSAGMPNRVSPASPIRLG